MNQKNDVQLWQAWQDAVRQEVKKRPWLASLLCQKRHHLFERFTLFYNRLRAAPRKLRRKLAYGVAAAALMLALSGVPAPPLQANATIVVTPGAAGIVADGQCSLVEAIINANDGAATHADCAPGSAGHDTIVLAGNAYSYDNAYGTDSALPDIAIEITIEANGATIARDNGDDTPNMRLIRVDAGGALTLNNAIITGGSGVNRGGGIYNRSGAITLNNSAVSGNTADAGGGIFNADGATTLNNSTVSGNTADDDGGGIFNFDGAITLNNSTVSGNSAKNGGGIFNDNGAANLNNSAVSANSASVGGGGIVSYYYNSATTLVRTIVSGNNANIGAEMRTVYGSIVGNNHNIIGYGGDARSSGFTPSGSDVVPPGALATVLNPTLADNGGPTLTHALVPGSPAIDIAPAADCLAPPINGVDQRGVTRPQGDGCDAGAVEMEQGVTAVLFLPLILSP